LGGRKASKKKEAISCDLPHDVGNSDCRAAKKRGDGEGPVLTRRRRGSYMMKLSILLRN